MSVSRRKFLRSGAVCALATGALLRTPLAALAQDARSNPSLDFRIPYEATVSPVFYFTRATFEPYLNGIFTAAGVGGKRVQLTLVAVRGYTPSSTTRLTTTPHRRTDCFSLTFRTTGQLRQLTNTHTLEHAALGRFDLFMTESTGRGARYYEAVINHPVNS